MPRRRWLETLREFLRPESVPNRAVPTMDGGLTPNSRLDGFRALAAVDAPEDLALAEPGALFVTAGNRLLHVDLALGATQVVATFVGRATGLAASPSGLLVCVS